MMASIYKPEEIDANKMQLKRKITMSSLKEAFKKFYYNVNKTTNHELFRIT